MSTNWSEELRGLDDVGPTRDLWAEAVARVAAPRARRVRSRRLLLAIAAVVLVGTATAFAYRILSPSPGFTAGLSGLESLPTVPWPADMSNHAPVFASAIGLTASEAESRLRLVQSGLSLGEERDLSLYAFPGNDGTGCIFLVPSVGGFCLPTWNADNPAFASVAWGVWTGDVPRMSASPAAIYGLAADNVSSVDADIGGVVHDIPIVDNSFYAVYDWDEVSQSIALVVHFADGATRTMPYSSPWATNGRTGAH